MQEKMREKLIEYLDKRLDILYKDKSKNIIEIVDVEEMLRYLKYDLEYKYEVEYA